MSDISKNLEKAKLELSQAQEDFKAAELLAESGFYSGASNRLYYFGRAVPPHAEGIRPLGKPWKKGHTV